MITGKYIAWIYITELKKEIQKQWPNIYVKFYWWDKSIKDTSPFM